MNEVGLGPGLEELAGEMRRGAAADRGEVDLAGTRLREVDELANGGGNRAYEEAAGLIARMGRLRCPTEQTAYVATLKERFGRRRNFVKLLG